VESLQTSPKYVETGVGLEAVMASRYFFVSYFLTIPDFKVLTHYINSKKFSN
jgi:hypothetical protein